MHTRLPPCSLHCCIGRSSCTRRTCTCTCACTCHMHIRTYVIVTFGSKRCGGQTNLLRSLFLIWVDSTGFARDS